MSDFLRDLSPHRAHHASRAVPLLPSPFEATHPLRAVRGDSAPPGLEDDSVAVVRRSAAPLRDSSMPAPASSQRPAISADIAASVERPLSTLPNDPPARPSQSIDAPLPATPSPIVTRLPRHTMPVAAPHHTAREATPVSAALSSPSIGADTTRPSRERAHPEISVASTLLTVEPPMSSRALTARVAPRTEQAPIINVTIDRIEVRAPAPPERAKPSTRSRPSTPNQSLSDYLRGREPERRGGRP
jgi:hypothetical protein